MTTPHDPTMSHSSLDAVIAAYMQSVEAGEVPNRQELLDQHPAIAEKLHAFFADVTDGPHGLPLESRRFARYERCQRKRPPALPTIRYLGDGELLAEVVRGGMGIVYKARQASPISGDLPVQTQKKKRRVNSFTDSNS